MSYVILTSKPGRFRTELTEGFTAVEAWEYRFHGKARAQFVIAAVAGAPRLTIIDLAGAPVVNRLPSKFLPRFTSPEAARAELSQLTRHGGAAAALVPLAVPA